MYAIPANRKYFPPSFFILTFGVALSLFLVYRHGFNAGDLVFLGVFGAALTLVIIQQLDKRPAVRITADGIHFKRWNKEWTNWEEIREVKLDWVMGRTRVLRLRLPHRERLIAVRYVQMEESELLRILLSLVAMKKEEREKFIRRLNEEPLVISLN